MLTFAAAKNGGLAQLARAPALHAGGQRFESVILHKKAGSICHPACILGCMCERDEESKQGRMADALALGGDEGRDKLR